MMNTEQLTEICQQHRAVLVNTEGGRIRVAVAGAPSAQLEQALAFASTQRVEIESWSPQRLEKYLQNVREVAVFDEKQNAAVALVAHALEQAVARRASDIHFEPDDSGGRIRLRVDGVLQSLTHFAGETGLAAIARLKILGNLDIAERRLPQDGQFDTDVHGETLSLRLSTLPCRGGEKAVLRLLRQQTRPLAPESLGMEPEALTLFMKTLAKPQGLLLVTGPTGSGKTLTLYSALNQLNHGTVNIACVEDPIEIPLDGITQTQVHPKAGLSFQTVLRALLRQDPDIIMIGEIRDAETADIALNAAQTGHLVLSTLHTQSCIETLTRLEQMGMARWQIACALELIVAQRLVRRLCSHCRQPAAQALLLPPSLSPEPVTHWRAVGCERCSGGYYDRLALFELMPVNAALRQAILAGESGQALEPLCRQLGMKTLLESGISAIRLGLTTVDELGRVLGLPHDPA